MKNRIGLTDDIMSATIKMGDGDPGAIAAVMDLVKLAPTVDSDSAFGPYAGLIWLDSFGVYGSDIYVLWNDVCKRNGRTVLMLLRAAQLGLMPYTDLFKPLDDAHIAALDERVCEALPNFEKA